MLLTSAGGVRPERHVIDDSGVVVDSACGVVPVADVMARHNATGMTTAVLTNSQACSACW
jgi:hypothetical protein